MKLLSSFIDAIFNSAQVKCQLALGNFHRNLRAIKNGICHLQTAKSDPTDSYRYTLSGLSLRDNFPVIKIKAQAMTALPLAPRCYCPEYAAHAAVRGVLARHINSVKMAFWRKSVFPGNGPVLDPACGLRPESKRHNPQGYKKVMYKLVGRVENISSNSLSVDSYALNDLLVVISGNIARHRPSAV